MNVGWYSLNYLNTLLPLSTVAITHTPYFLGQLLCYTHRNNTYPKYHLTYWTLYLENHQWILILTTILEIITKVRKFILFLIFNFLFISTKELIDGHHSHLTHLPFFLITTAHCLVIFS